MKFFSRKYLMGAAAVTAMMSLSSATNADFVHPEDVIIQGSLCVGFDCVNGESFGFDTLRLKENNLRVHFDDTSSSASFPSNDWRIVVNDSSNGGGNYFAVEDSTAARQVFLVEAGAPASSLFVENTGDVGLGTSNPVSDLHIARGDTPTLRLEQNGSSGFTPQTWDIAGNEANFFIRDATSGSRLVFRIEPGAGTNALFVEDTNDIGLGTNTPDENIHMVDSSGAFFGMRYEDTSAGGAGSSWRTLVDPRVAHDEFVITKSGTGAAEMTIGSGGDVTITGTMTTGGGTCGGGCDLVFTDAYDVPSIEEHASAMWENGFLPNVGPTIENAPMNISDKVGRILNELETAHIYIDQLNERVAVVDELTARLAVLEAQIAEQNDG
jgi:hypothetical protein